MGNNSRLKRPVAASGIFYLALLIMVTALQLSPLTAQAAQANLSWIAPTSYTDGMPITNLAGYKVYTGTTSGSYSQNIDVGNVTSYSLLSLNDATTYYSTVIAYDTYGNASKPSSQITFTTATPPSATPLYVLAAAAGSGGSIAPSGSVALSQGSNQTFTLTPAAGYRISGVTVDGASVGATSSYTFSNVAANHTIQASFISSSTGSVAFSANSGGSQYASSTGFTYLADAKYSGGLVGSTTATINGTTEGALYQSERYGNFSYNIPVANGSYQVILKFAEIYWAATGKRVFSAAINGQTVISNLDIFAKVGKNAAYDVVIPVNVTNGGINIQFINQVNYAKVNAILVKTQ